MRKFLIAASMVGMMAFSGSAVAQELTVEEAIEQIRVACTGGGNCAQVVQALTATFSISPNAAAFGRAAATLATSLPADVANTITENVAATASAEVVSSFQVAAAEIGAAPTPAGIAPPAPAGIGAPGAAGSPG